MGEESSHRWRVHGVLESDVSAAGEKSRPGFRTFFGAKMCRARKSRRALAKLYFTSIAADGEAGEKRRAGRVNVIGKSEWHGVG